MFVLARVHAGASDAPANFNWYDLLRAVQTHSLGLGTRYQCLCLVCEDNAEDR